MRTIHHGRFRDLVFRTELERIVVTILVAALLAASAWAGGTRYYVDPDVAERGTAGWNVAFPTLEQALAVAVSGDEIWIAEGIYRPPSPTRGAVDPAATFSVQRGVRLVGGFAGWETNEADADPVAHPTILSGDLEGDDLDNDGTGVIEHPVLQRGTNARHIVTIVGTDDVETTLRGLILTAGNSDDGNDTHVGFDDQGAAIDCAGAEVRLEDLLVRGNHAERNAILATCPEIEVYDSTFRDNRSYSVGAISHDSGTWERCVFEDQYALSGGSVFRAFGKTLSVINSQFRYNLNPPVELINGTAHFEGVVFVGNLANPAAIEVDGSGSLSVVNSTFVGNAPWGDTSVVLALGSADVEIYNSIFWSNNGGNTDPMLATAVANDGTGTMTVQHSIVQGSGGSTAWSLIDVVDGGNNLDEDPLFVRVPSYTEAEFTRETDANTHLTPDSPALDAGTNAPVTTSLDADGRPRKATDTRITQAIVDIGAWEGAVGEAEITLALSNGSGSAVPGATTEYELVATNTESFPLDVHLTEELPDGMSCVWELEPSEAADGNTVSGLGGLDWTQPLSPAASVTGTGVCSIEPHLTGTVETQVTVRTAGDVPWVVGPVDDVSDTDVLVPTANVTATQVSYPPGIFRGEAVTDEFYRGDTIVYAISVVNEGPSNDPAVRVVDQFPEAVENCSTLFCQIGDCSVVDGTVDLTFPAGVGEYPFAFQCTVRADAPLGAFTNTVTVTPGEGMVGDDPNDNEIDETDYVLETPIFADGFEDGSTVAWSGDGSTARTTG